MVGRRANRGAGAGRSRCGGAFGEQRLAPASGQGPPPTGGPASRETSAARRSGMRRTSARWSLARERRPLGRSASGAGAPLDANGRRSGGGRPVPGGRIRPAGRRRHAGRDRRAARRGVAPQGQGKVEKAIGAVRGSPRQRLQIPTWAKPPAMSAAPDFDQRGGKSASMMSVTQVPAAESNRFMFVGSSQIAQPTPAVSHCSRTVVTSRTRESIAPPLCGPHSPL